MPTAKWLVYQRIHIVDAAGLAYPGLRIGRPPPIAHVLGTAMVSRLPGLDYSRLRIALPTPCSSPAIDTGSMELRARTAVVRRLLRDRIMRHGLEEASTHRRVDRSGVAPARVPAAALDIDTDAPTFLPRGPVPAGIAGTPYTQQSAYQPHTQPSHHAPRESTEPSVHAIQPEIEVPIRRRARASEPSSSPSFSGVGTSPRRVRGDASVAGPVPAAAPAPVRAEASPLPGPLPSAPAAEPASRPSSSRRASGPDIPGLIDPLAIPVPPELAPSIYSWVRRLALQADLPTADRVLRDALTELTSSLSVTIIYPGQDGLWTLGADDEIPREAGPIVACAQARRAMVASHTALVPICTSSETVGVVVLTRNPRNPGYLPVEQIAALGLARESAAILHHLAIHHLQKESELKADKGSLYRGEALEAHRSKGSEGVPVHLSPGWVKRTYPLLVGALLVALAFSVFITVPTYSSGQAAVMFDGLQVTAAQGGTIAQVNVQPGQAVNAGDIVLRLAAQAELDELSGAKTQFDAALRSSLWDGTDENVRKNLQSAYTQYDLARRKVAAKTVRAPKAGVISDIRVRVGNALQPGEQIATIVQPGTTPEVWAFLPAKDRPRLRTGMRLQVELVGYTKTRELATIVDVSSEAVGGTEIAKQIGPALADAFKLPPGGSYVVVKARLPGRTFKTEHRTMNYHHGMTALSEVKIASKPFLVTLLPALEKYIPD